MLIVKFMGGFANQLFQLCLYKKLLEDYPKKEVVIDISRYKTHDDHGGFKMNKFINNKYIDKLPSNYIEINEENFHSTRITDNNNFLFKGYWQDTKFFPHNLTFLSEIINENGLNSNGLLLLEEIKRNESVAVHVRRGDYINNHYHGFISTKYYYNTAIEYIREHKYNPIFYVFSDDLDWCKNNIQNDKNDIRFVENISGNVIDDIFLMSECKNIVMSNSSFSWWSYYINKNNKDIIISTKYWFNDSKQTSLEIENKTTIDSYDVKKLTQKKQNSLITYIVNKGNNEIDYHRCISSILNQNSNRLDKTIVNIDIGNRINIKEIESKYYMILEEYEYLSENFENELFEILDKKDLDMIGVRKIDYLMEREAIVPLIFKSNIGFPCTVDLCIESNCYTVFKDESYLYSLLISKLMTKSSKIDENIIMKLCSVNNNYFSIAAHILLNAIKKNYKRIKTIIKTILFSFKKINC